MSTSLHHRDIWPALLLAPLLALGGQSLAYALITPLCEHQAGAWMHAVFAALLLAVLLLSAFAGREALRLQRAHAGSVPAETDRHGPYKLFLARVATGVGLLSALAVLAMWIPPWLLSPCQQ